MFNVRCVCSVSLETYDPSEQPQQLHPSSSNEKKNSKAQPTQALSTGPGLLVPLLETVSPTSAQMPPAPLTAPTIQLSTLPTFQTTRDAATITVPDSSVQIKQEPASLNLGEASVTIPAQTPPCSPQVELQFQDGMFA